VGGGGGGVVGGVGGGGGGVLWVLVGVTRYWGGGFVCVIGGGLREMGGGCFIIVGGVLGFCVGSLLGGGGLFVPRPGSWGGCYWYGIVLEVLTHDQLGRRYGDIKGLWATRVPISWSEGRLLR